MNLARPIVLSIALAAACSGGSTGGAAYPPGEQPFDGGTLPPITDYLTGVKSSDGVIRGQLVMSPPPVVRNSAPTISMLASGFTIPGGSKIATVNAGTSPYVRVVVAVLGATGYYELSGLTAASSNIIVFSVSQTAAQSFTVLVAVGGPSDSFCPACTLGPFYSLRVNLTPVGTGDVQISLVWDAFSDLDLHVVQPTGREIYWRDRKDPVTGGTLDLDSNAGCTIDGRNNENVTWQGGQPPRGQYIVRVDNWSSCGAPRSNFVVTVNVKGQETQTFFGFFTDIGDKLGAGAGIEITRFTY
jgi:hypothetical protein